MAYLIVPLYKVTNDYKMVREFADRKKLEIPVGDELFLRVPLRSVLLRSELGGSLHQSQRWSQGMLKKKCSERHYRAQED